VNTSPHVPDVISAFLDNEPFDAGELSAALADPAGRAAFIDLIALRGLVQSDIGTMPVAHPRPRRAWRLIAAGIVLPLALVAGYSLGWRAGASHTPDAVVDNAPPAPTRVITNLEWTTGKGGN
jgi:hypothetical protein